VCNGILGIVIIDSQVCVTLGLGKCVVLCQELTLLEKDTQQVALYQYFVFQCNLWSSGRYKE
jgi:hypothetical protein